MERTTLAVLVADDRGIIVGQGGDAARFGFNGNLVGKSCAEVFSNGHAQWSESGWPVRAQIQVPNGERAQVDVCSLSAPESRRLLIIRDEDAGLTPQQEVLCGLGELSASVAHEINNALTLLCGWLELVKGETAPGSSQYKTMELLAGESERIGHLTRNLLQVARGANEKPHDIDLAALVAEVVKLMQYDMKNCNIEVETRLAAGLPPVCGSAGRLKQALINLLVNARQAMPGGGKLAIIAQADGAGRVTLSVEDSGPGIAPELQGKIFSPFFTTKREGTGLGLPVTRRIAEDHGGTLSLRSRPGEGARFTLSLPARAQ